MRAWETPTSGEVIIVKDGESIQEAVAKAEPGAVIKVMPGTYKETVYIDKDNITLSGVIEQGRYPVMDGEGVRNDAVLYSGNGVTVENLYITHYKGNAIMGQAGNNFIIRNNYIVDTGVYGIFPQLGKNGSSRTILSPELKTPRFTWACLTMSMLFTTRCLTVWPVLRSKTAAPH